MSEGKKLSWVGLSEVSRSYQNNICKAPVLPAVTAGTSDKGKKETVSTTTQTQLYLVIIYLWKGTCSLKEGQLEMKHI